ncbi:hypothetical protein ACET3Z_028339 [Daucus carota]
MGVSDAGRLVDLDYEQEIANINLSAETFTHPNSNIQKFAVMGNVEAEQHLNLVRTSEALMQAKDAVKKLPPATEGMFTHPDDKVEEEAWDDENLVDVDFEDVEVETDVDEEDEHSPKRAESKEAEVQTSQPSTGATHLGGVEDPNSENLRAPEWLYRKESHPTYLYSTLLGLIRQARKNIAETSDPALKAILQLHLDSLKVHQIHYYQGIRDLEEVKDKVDTIKSDVLKNLGAEVGDFTMKDFQQRLRKEPKTEDKLKDLSDRVGKIELQMTALNEHNSHQSALLEKLVAALQKPSNPAQLDDDKKGEKTSEVHIQVTKVLVPSITISKASTPPTTRIDLINEKAEVLRAQAQHQSMEPDFGGEASKEIKDTVKFSTQLQPLKIKDYTPKTNASGFSPPRPDAKKFLKDAILNLKETADVALKAKMAIIYRNGLKIHVIEGHPQFQEARAEYERRIGAQKLRHKQGHEQVEKKKATCQKEAKC